MAARRAVRRLEPDVEVPGSFAAVTELASNFLAHVTQRFTTYLREYAERDDPVWRDATSLNQMTFWATAEEAAQIQEQLERLADSFEGRSTDPALRPEGARRVRLASLIHPDLPTSSTE